MVSYVPQEKHGAKRTRKKRWLLLKLPKILQQQQQPKWDKEVHVVQARRTPKV